MDQMSGREREREREIGFNDGWCKRVQQCNLIPNKWLNNLLILTFFRNWCVCVCVCKNERERERDKMPT